MFHFGSSHSALVRVSTVIKINFSFHYAGWGVNKWIHEFIKYRKVCNISAPGSLRWSRLSVLLQLHLHSQLNTWLQWIGQRQQQAETRNIYIWGMDASYIRDMMVESFSYNVAPMHIWNPNVPNTVGADVAPRAKTRTTSEDPLNTSLCKTCKQLAKYS